MVRILLATVLWLISATTIAQDYEVQCLSINSPEADFSGVFHGNDLIFCSNRSKMNMSFDDDSLTLYCTDLFVSKAKYDGTFTTPEPLNTLNTLNNEGHATISKDGKRMYYTANLDRSVSNIMENTTVYKLGIFMAEYENGNWTNKGEFPFNAVNAKYSVAHPSLSANDSVLYFSSNMRGGEGKSDMYKCIWQNGAWSEPINLGNKVNSRGNEFFPFISESNVLYFSTDSRSDSEGMDIYYSKTNADGEFEKPIRLNNTINSPYDDFAYQEKPGVNMGTFSSNRNGEQDDIFIFNKYFNTFQDCHENYSANFCYHFMDETLANIDSLPIKYEWNLGDGTIVYGNSIDHCFKDYGKYPITLSAIDTATKMVFRKISETEITISRQDKPFILSHDTIFASVPFEAKAELFAFDDFEITEIHWGLSDGSEYTGETLIHTFTETGYHQIKCEVAGKLNKNGIVPKVCVYKNVEVVMPSAANAPEPLRCCDGRVYKKISLRPAILATNIESKQLKKIYKPIIAETENALTNRNQTELASERTCTYNMISPEGIASSQQHSKDHLSANSDSPVIADQREYVSTNYESTATHFSSDSILQKEPERESQTSITAISEQTSTDPQNLLYRIKLFQSTERIPFNDSRFSKIKTTITETKTDHGFQYSIMAVPQAEDLNELLTEVKSIGFSEAMTQSFTMEQTNNEIVRAGRYIERGNSKRLNIEFSRLSDIKFEYNSAEISKDSYKTLNYIAAMLSLEEDFTLKVAAHTCAIGGQEFNQTLSEQRAKAVVNYIASKGISTNRLIAAGHGMTKPLQSNESEMGRVANRRVEFIVIFQADTK
jgi:outer membrane protein OmpA-like peptidoglycan-associated protein